MSVFGTSDVSQQGGTAVSPTQDAVADNSSLIQGAGELLKGGVAFVAKSNEIDAADQAQTAISGLSGEFKSINEMVASGKLTTNAARARKNQLSLTAIGAGADQKAVKGLLGIGFGQEENFVSPELKAQQDAMKAANKAGRIKHWQTPEEKEAASRSYTNETIALAEMDRTSKEIGLLTQKQGYAKGEYELEIAELKYKGNKALKNFAVSTNENKVSVLTGFIDEWENSDQLTSTKADIMLRFEQDKAALKANINWIGKNSDPAMINSISNSILFQYDVAERVLNDEISTEAADRLTKNAIAYQKSIAIQDLSIQQLAGLEELFSGLMAASPTKNVAGTKFLMAENAVAYGGKRAVDIVVDKGEEDAEPGLTKKIGGYLDAVGSLFKTYTGATTEVPDKDKEVFEGGVLKQAEAVARSFANNPTSGNPAVAAPVVKLFASEAYGASIKKGGSKVNAEVQDLAQEALTVYGGKVVDSIKKKLSDTGGIYRGSPNGMIGMFTPTVSMKGGKFSIDMKLKKGFKELTPIQQKIHNENLTTIKKVMTQYIRAGAHIQGHTNYEKEFNESYAALFGEFQMTGKVNRNEAK